MPFQKMTPGWNPTRILLSGPPNSRKTSSLLTFPFDREHSPDDDSFTGGLHVVFLPGEKGWDSLDLSIPGVFGYKWVVEDPSKLSADTIIKEFEGLVFQIIKGEHGKCTTLGLDGLHKAYGWYYKRATVGASTDDAFSRAYAVAHDDFTLFLHRVCHSTVPYVVGTVWDGKEQDNPDVKKGPSHVFPDLPGKMAKRIMGEFGVVLACNVGLAPAPNKPAPATWQTKPEGGTWGAGCKIPKHIAEKMPTFVEQDWAKLEPILRGEQTVKKP